MEIASSQSPEHHDSSFVPPLPISGPKHESADRALSLEAKVDRLLALNEALLAQLQNQQDEIFEIRTSIQRARSGESAFAANVPAVAGERPRSRLTPTIFNHSPDALLVIDSNYELVEVNENAVRVLELSFPYPKDIKTYLLGLFESDRLDNWFEYALNCNENRSYEIYRYTDGTLAIPIDHIAKWVEISASPLIVGDESSEYFLITARDISHRKKIETEFQRQALHDNVTQLPNRRFFIKQVEALLSRKQTHFAICFLDLDNFKSVNDSLGHEAGDQLLIQVSERIQAKTRKDCFLARFGGDEFALLVPNMPTDKVAAIGRRIVCELRKPFEINHRSVYISASIGMTRYPDDASNVSALLHNADAAMYSAKESGRNQFHLFTPELASSMKERQSILEDLRVALDNKEVDLEYQPKWCMRKNRLTGCEALLRWRRNGKLVSPLVVIETAEMSGLILQLGDVVMEKALQQLRQWRETHSFEGKMAINISAEQLVDNLFVDRFKRLASRYKVPTHAVELEITETAMMKNFNRASVQLSLLKKSGASIAIDDFGTGYSSLSYLKWFPVSTLKIDRSFVKDLPSDPKAIAVAKAVLSLGHGLGLEVVAEGVETKEQYHFLCESGCDQTQGFLFSRSLPPSEFVDWFSKSSSDFEFLD